MRNDISHALIPARRPEGRAVWRALSVSHEAHGRLEQMARPLARVQPTLSHGINGRGQGWRPGPETWTQPVCQGQPSLPQTCRLVALRSSPMTGRAGAQPRGNHLDSARRKGGEPASQLSLLGPQTTGAMRRRMGLLHEIRITATPLIPHVFEAAPWTAPHLLELSTPPSH